MLKVTKTNHSTLLLLDHRAFCLDEAGIVTCTYRVFEPFTFIADLLATGATLSPCNTLPEGFYTDDLGYVNAYPLWQGCLSEMEANVLAQEAGWSGWQEEWLVEYSPTFGESTLEKIRRQKELLLDDRDK